MQRLTASWMPLALLSLAITACETAPAGSSPDHSAQATSALLSPAPTAAATQIGTAYNCPLASGTSYNVGNIGYSFTYDEQGYAAAKLMVEKNCFPPDAARAIERQVTFYVSTVNFPSNGTPGGVGAAEEQRWLNYWHMNVQRFSALGYKIVILPNPFILNENPANDVKPGMRLLRKSDLNLGASAIPEVFQCRDGRKSVLASIYDPRTLRMGTLFYQGIQNFFGGYPAVVKIAIVPSSDFGEYGFPFGVTDANGAGVGWWQTSASLANCYKTGDSYARALIASDPPPVALYNGKLNEFRAQMTSAVKRILPGKRYMLYLGFGSDFVPYDGFDYAEAVQYSVANGIDVHSSHLCGLSGTEYAMAKISGAMPANYPFTFENCGGLGEYEAIRNLAYTQKYKAKGVINYASFLYDYLFTAALAYSTGAPPAYSLVPDKAMSALPKGGVAALRSAHFQHGYMDAPRPGATIQGDAMNSMFGWGFYNTYGDQHNYGVLVYAGQLFESSGLGVDAHPERDVKGLHPQFMRKVAYTTTQYERGVGVGDKSRFGLSWKPNLAAGKAVVRVFFVNGHAEIVAEHPDSPMIVNVQSKISGSFLVGRTNYQFGTSNVCSRSFTVSGSATNAATPGQPVEIVVLDEYRGKIVHQAFTQANGQFNFAVNIPNVAGERTRFVTFRAYVLVDNDGDGVKELVGLKWNMTSPWSTVGENVVSNPFFSILDCATDPAVAAPRAPRAQANDFDGDGKTDYTVWRPSDGTWWVRPAAAGDGTNGWFNRQWGLPGDVPVSQDYDGDGLTDFAVWRPSDGSFYVRPAAAGAGTTGAFVRQWGTAGDIPVPGDYNGDGMADFAVYRPSAAYWYVWPSHAATSETSWFGGQLGAAGDIPMPADFTGDGKADFAIFRPASATWSIQGNPNAIQWGIGGDVPFTGDYNGDGASELGVFRPSNATWFVNGIPGSVQWGIAGDIPVIGDNNGDGRSDYSIWRYSDVTWWTFGGPYNRVWGAVGDQPLSAGTPGSECRTIYNGRHNTVGLSENGDKRFACLNNRWYDCGWELNDPRWETKVGNGARIGNWTCNLASATWSYTP